MHYYGEDEYLRRTSRENSGTGVERLQPIMEGKSYKGMSKKLQFIMNNNTCVKKKYNKL